MLITATTLMLFYGVAALFIIGGLATKNVQAAAIGISFLFLAGATVLINGINERTGETSAISPDNSTSTSYVYTNNKGVLSNGLGAASILLAVASFAYLYNLKVDGDRRRQSGEED